jgi:hypothetical protein
MTNTTTTPVEAVARLAAYAPLLEAARTQRKEAEQAMDGAASAAAKALLASLRGESRSLIASLTDEAVSDGRVDAVVRAAETGPSPRDLKKIAEAIRCGTGSRVVLPRGQYDHLSRGRGWCRHGSGSDAVWAESSEGGWAATLPGTWTVGTSDGFKRKDTVVWTVETVGGVWIAN